MEQLGSLVMFAYIVRRFFRAILTIVFVVTLVFVALRVTGDPVTMMLGENATPELVEEYRSRYGLDKPLTVQYFRFMRAAAEGDFGTSLWQKEPALDLVLDRVPASVELAGVSMLFALAFALPIGVWSAVNRNTFGDRLIMVFTLFGQSAPTFWVGIMLILIIAVKLRLLPTSGRDGIPNLILPSLTLAIWAIAPIARMTRSAMLDILSKTYINTARAKGLRERRVLFVHAFRNAAIPVVTIVAMQLGGLLSGSMVTETVFAWPGFGRLAIQSIMQRDYPVVQAIVFLVSVTFVLINFGVDVLYAWLDPRIRYE